MSEILKMEARDNVFNVQYPSGYFLGLEPFPKECPFRIEVGVLRRKKNQLP